MTRYIVLYDTELPKLIEAVNSNLKRGWVICGTMAVDANYCYYQPMTREE